MTRQAVPISSLLTRKLASTHCTVLSPREGTRERGRGLQIPPNSSLCIFLAVKCLWLIRGMLPLIGETQVSLQIAILSNGKDHRPTLGQALFYLGNVRQEENRPHRTKWSVTSPPGPKAKIFYLFVCLWGFICFFCFALY